MFNIKKLCIPICLVTMLCLTGCRGDVDLNPDKIHVDFKTFGVTDTSHVNTVSVKEIDLKDDRITDENIETIMNNVKTVYDTLGNYEYNLGKIGENKTYYTPVEEYFTPTFYDTLCKSNYHYIYETMMDIYKNTNHGYYGCNVTEIDVMDTQHLEVNVEILSIQDGTLFSQTEKLTLTNEGKIDNIEKLENIHTVENSSSPIYSTNFSNMNDKFQNTLSNFLSSISNKYLYEKYETMKNGTMEVKEEEKEEKTREIQLQVETLLQKDGMDVETLEKVFESGKGTFEDYGIVNYRIINEENREETIYTVGFVYNKEIRYFHFTYSRLLDQITNVEEMEIVDNSQ